MIYLIGIGIQTPNNLRERFFPRTVNEVFIDPIFYDIRANRENDGIAWTPKAITANYGFRYRHFPELSPLSDLDAGIRVLTNESLKVEREKRSIVLFCSCYQARGCHRFGIRRALSAIGIKTLELNLSSVAKKIERLKW